MITDHPWPFLKKWPQPPPPKKMWSWKVVQKLFFRKWLQNDSWPFLEKLSHPPTHPPGLDHFSKNFPNCHILLLTQIWSLAWSIKRAVGGRKVHLPIKSIEEMFVFGPHLGNWALFQKSVKSIKIWSVIIPDPFWKKWPQPPSPSSERGPKKWSKIFFRKWLQNDQWSFLAIFGKVVPPLGQDCFLKNFPNCHVLLLTQIWTLVWSIKHAVAAGKVHLPIKSIESMFVFGPYLGNWALFQKSVKSIKIWSVIIPDHYQKSAPPLPPKSPKKWSKIFFRKWLQNDQWSFLAIFGKVVPTPPPGFGPLFKIFSKLPYLASHPDLEPCVNILCAVGGGKVHLPIKSIEKMFVFGPYLRNWALFQKSVKSIKIWSVIILDHFWKSGPNLKYILIQHF